MKKFVAFLCGAAVALSAMNCSATVSSDKIGIAGIRPGMTADEVLRVAGQPNFKSDNGYEWHYNNFGIEFEDYRPNIVDEIETRVNSASTPAGVYVGQSESVLSSTYGAADKVERDKYSTEYTYYSDDYSMTIEFQVVNGVIYKIECQLRN
ncbi:MAG: hypothetical protein IJS29_04750 [Selenomonadaceae bacterium]|nr:hypothetical protein [Selenomonadaceae bacterium]